MEKFKKHERCRVCAGELREILDYGRMPLANGLKDTYEEAEAAERFEQRLLVCPRCHLGQLSLVVDPEILYRGYVYRSSTSEEFKLHCRELARDLWRYRPGRVIDIAGNDGALMREILAENQTAIGYVVDTSQDDAPANYEKIKAFWNAQTARKFREEHGAAAIITAQNVVGHVDDVYEFFGAVHDTLEPYGLFVVEVPSFVRLVGGLAFDTVYHEHLSYWSVTALDALATRTGFDIVRVEEKPVHCGTLRVWMRKNTDHFLAGVPSSLKARLAAEGKFFAGDWAQDFHLAVSDRVAQLNRILRHANRVVGVTAGAKSSVLLNTLSVPCHFLVDNTPGKHGKYLPAKSPVPIRPFTPDYLRQADVAVILSRNWKTPLIKQLDEMGFSGVIVTV